jgi:hypothetical protein
LFIVLSFADPAMADVFVNLKRGAAYSFADDIKILTQEFLDSEIFFFWRYDQVKDATTVGTRGLGHSILKGEVSLYH